MAQTIFTIIIVIIVFDFVFERFLEYLNSTKRSPKLPKELEGIYDSDAYAKQQNYEKENSRFSMFSSTFSFLLIVAVLAFDGFAIIDNFARQFTENSILIALIFFGILMFASDILSTPFSIYDTFVIEEKYGFNKTTAKTFVLDKLKGWGLSVILGGGMLALIIWFYEYTGAMFWIYTWWAVTAVMIFMAMFYSSLIVPLFNKQTPLEEGELRDEIQSFCKKVGFKLDNIFVINGSKRSTKANAYFSGLGAKKRIVLYDTLIEDMSNEELTGVLAHEIGHYKKKHTQTGIAISIIQTGLTLFILSIFIANPILSEALGTENHSFHLAIITFGILYSPISTITGLAMNILSRKNEYQADKYACDNYDSQPLASSLKKLSVKNLSNLTPHPLVVFFHYSHPTLLQRLRAMAKVES
ncbi:MAG: M48 family metallopeptidase [Bacteroidetes bacterium]|jgi:STE24 endopeptidase|nr:M48 family metallopeptidase [Bacteroidota bacterium]MBT6685422.1 M48 family metallopeptidase [Bacteroidota bacterium]MBT7144218.1 M48 family metallopeptidase [Bacteroidota bacterium]MBT7492148.1 M48 family metallopeptidase [Bacteroidota bacterium]